MYKNLLKIIISNLFLIAFVFNQNVYSKPIPPGSGEGDVPANILILLDSSLSMQSPITTGASIKYPWDIVEDSDGNLIMTGGGNQGVIKLITSTEQKDPNFGNKGKYKGTKKDSNCSNKDSSMKQPNSLGISSNVAGYTGNVIFASEDNHDKGKIVMFNKDGECLDVITHNQLGGFRPRALTVRTIGDADYLIAAGRWWVKRGRRGGDWAARMYSRNLTTGATATCNVNSGNFQSLIHNLWSISMDDGNYLYVVNQNTSHVEGYELTLSGGTYCPTDTTRDRHYQDATSGNAIRDADAVEVDPDDNNVLWIGSYGADTIQRVTISGETVTASVTKGSWGKGNTTSDDDVNMIDPFGFYVTSDNVFVGVRNPTVLQFANDSTITWENQMGGGAVTRLQGAKEAIKAIMNDSSLTSGANFGYGHWNSGRGWKNKWHDFGQSTCHFTTKGVPRAKVKNGNDNCPYWDGWNGSHPEGKSTLCNKDSCINVGVSANGFTEIPDAVDATRMAWGTDANAFSRMAYGYYTDESLDIIDEDSTCQLNYVIVISDGAWTHGDKAELLIDSLRADHKVKTLVVAYGGGIKGSSLDRYERMARAGSCGTDGSAECKPYIKADTPQELKTHLQSAIQQIIADKLSFTAPAITATIQEGGSLYQAQFNYQQYGEWQGTILRKAIDANQKVIHDVNHEGNWNAAEMVKAQTSRNIWTALPTAHYKGNWDNWKPDNRSEISALFDVLQNRVLDYHNKSSTCPTDTTGISDDIDGLINFVRGQDYFDYNGDCDLTEKRDWCDVFDAETNVCLEGASMLGDIYHSQIVEIGPPSANFDFTDTNEESFWRAQNNYQSFARHHEGRENVIYAGANDGMLHAFKAATGEEAWGFVPPFIAGKLPTLINVGLDGKVDGKKGGSNAIFGVDGSPVVHDMFIRGLTYDGRSWEGGKSWRTILIIPYGRGGAGFSVLDVTNPLVEEDLGPLHMFSVYNDAVHNKVLIADQNGVITEYPYLPEYINWESSREARRAIENNSAAATSDAARDDGLDTDVDAIYECQTLADTTNDFAGNGTGACYKGTKFTFDFTPPEDETLSTSDFRYYEGTDRTARKPSAVSTSDGTVTLTFPNELIFNASQSDLIADDGSTDTSSIRIRIKPSLAGVQDHDYKYNYSKLGETWSTPRVFRMPNPDVVSGEFFEDIYVFVMGGGMGSAVGKTGSNVFVVDLENREHPGAIAGANLNLGPITIVDTKGGTTNGSNIANAIPSSPVVITPENVHGLNWRGAMVYVNDLEGKITKINLTNLPDAQLFQQKTIANLHATKANARLNYHSMDAAIGRDTKRFWLFGSTGHYERINDSTEFDNDNILYGIKDDYKSFTSDLLLEGSTFYDAWRNAALDHAEKAPRIDNLQVCKDTTKDTTGAECPTNSNLGWVIYLNDMANNEHKKASATPRVYKGNVYFPIYKPAMGANKCNLGSAYICSADDECGTNTSRSLTGGGQMPDEDDCFYVTEGILSELVVFADTLYANVAGPSKTEDTLVSILAGTGEVGSYRRSWREGY